MDPSKRQSFTSLLFTLNCLSKTLIILKNNSCKFLDTPSVQSGGRGGSKNQGGYNKATGTTVIRSTIIKPKQSYQASCIKRENNAKECNLDSFCMR